MSVQRQHTYFVNHPVQLWAATYANMRCLAKFGFVYVFTHRHILSPNCHRPRATLSFYTEMNEQPTYSRTKKSFMLCVQC